MGFFTDTFPARKSAMNLPRFQDPILANLKAMLPYGRRVPPAKNWQQITQAYERFAAAVQEINGAFAK